MTVLYYSLDKLHILIFNFFYFSTEMFGYLLEMP